MLTPATKFNTETSSKISNLHNFKRGLVKESLIILGDGVVNKKASRKHNYDLPRQHCRSIVVSRSWKRRLSQSEDQDYTMDQDQERRVVPRTKTCPRAGRMPTWLGQITSTLVQIRVLLVTKCLGGQCGEIQQVNNGCDGVSQKSL